MKTARRTALSITLVALIAALLPGVCAADCGSIMECCRQAPTSDTVIGSSTCCKGERPNLSGPTATTAEVRSRIAREASSPTPAAAHALVTTGRVIVARYASGPSRAHRAPDVPLFLLNAAVLR